MKNQRMLDELTELMRIDVSSGQETEIAEHLVKKLEQMGFAITRDEAGATFGGVCGNILAVREGERDGVVCFCSHMDRVPGGIGIKPVEEDGILRYGKVPNLTAECVEPLAEKELAVAQQKEEKLQGEVQSCLLYTSPSPRD